MAPLRRRTPPHPSQDSPSVSPINTQFHHPHSSSSSTLAHFLCSPHKISSEKFLSMADMDTDHSCCGDSSSVDSRGDVSRDSKPEFSEDEETLITRMYKLVGERWSLIAGRIPGRSAEEIEKFWTSRYSSSSED